MSIMAAKEILRGSIRWALNVNQWDPTEDQWLFASSCMTQEEKEKVNKYVFKVDAKCSLIGTLMARRMAHLATSWSYDLITICRDKKGRPLIAIDDTKMDFNISHQGNYTVFAGEVGNDNIVGVDIMNLQRKTGHELSEFFRMMHKTMSADEWNTILTCRSDEEKTSMFFRHWCLKESYLKATGVGVRTDLRHCSFKLKTTKLSVDRPTTDTVMEIDRVKDLNWTFHEYLLDPQHCVAVALCTRSGEAPAVQPVPFMLLSYNDVIRYANPFMPPDVCSARSFMVKEEKGRAHDTR